MHSRRSQGHGIGTRMLGEWDGLFHTPSIPDLGAQSYSLNMVKPEFLVIVEFGKRYPLHLGEILVEAINKQSPGGWMRLRLKGLVYWIPYGMSSMVVAGRRHWKTS